MMAHSFRGHGCCFSDAHATPRGWAIIISPPGNDPGHTQNNLPGRRDRRADPHEEPLPDTGRADPQQPAVRHAGPGREGGRHVQALQGPATSLPRAPPPSPRSWPPPSSSSPSGTIPDTNPGEKGSINSHPWRCWPMRTPSTSGSSGTAKHLLHRLDQYHDRGLSWPVGSDKTAQSRSFRQIITTALLCQTLKVIPAGPARRDAAGAGTRPRGCGNGVRGGCAG